LQRFFRQSPRTLNCPKGPGSSKQNKIFLALTIDILRALINSRSSGRNTSASFAAARNASYFRAVSSFSIEGIVAVNFIFGNKGIGYGLLIRALKKTKKVLQQLILYKRISIDFQYNFLGLLTVIVKQGA